MLALLGTIQAGIWIHGRNVAVRAANAAVDVARGSFGETDQARETAFDLAAAGGLEGITVSVTRGSGRVDVTVSGQVPMMLDLGLGRIGETASAPIERMSQP